MTPSQLTHLLTVDNSFVRNWFLKRRRQCWHIVSKDIRQIKFLSLESRNIDVSRSAVNRFVKKEIDKQNGGSSPEKSVPNQHQPSLRFLETAWKSSSCYYPAESTVSATNGADVWSIPDHDPESHSSRSRRKVEKKQRKLHALSDAQAAPRLDLGPGLHRLRNMTLKYCKFIRRSDSPYG